VQDSKHIYGSNSYGFRQQVHKTSTGIITS